jgi:hypothetical protein
MAKKVNREIDDEATDDFDYDLDDNSTTFDLEEFKAMGINPFKSTPARPGSDEKVTMLSARYAAGLPLWHDSDCYDHGPHERDLMGVLGGDVAPQFVVQAEEEEEEEV